MGIEQICNTIKNLFSNIRPPFPQLPRLPLVCSMIRRPGLSVAQSVANATKEVNKLGIPTGAMPDGSSNLTIGVIYSIVEEVYRAMKNDASVQGGVTPGTIMIQAGPFPGTNTTTGMIQVKIN
jgi:hypothetical protein